MYTEFHPMYRCAGFFVVLALTLSLNAQQKPAKAMPPASKSPDDSQLYRNSAYGFRYRIPVGWVERTKALQEGNEPGKGEVLLAIFERPPEAAGDTVNSAVVIATESVGSYPGLKRAEDYLGPLTELTTSKGFKVDGDPSEVTIDGRTLVRADFMKPLMGDLSMHQSTLLMLQKKQIVTLTFLAGSNDEVDELIQGLGFAAARSGH